MKSNAKFIDAVSKSTLLVVQISIFKSNMNANMSIFKPLADHYGINNKTEVKVKLCKDFSLYEIDNVAFTVKDQYLSRKDQWYF